jgi:hypothetical protein
MTRPFECRAARPAVWMRLVSLLRKPSLSASRIATSATSGRSRPSRRRLIPIRASKLPSRRLRRISMRSIVSMSECRYSTRTPASRRKVVRSSERRLVSVVTSTRSPAAAAALISPIRCSTCPLIGRIVISGSRRPVGTDDLLRHDGGSPQLDRRRRRGDVEGLPCDAIELLDALGPVVEGRGQAETEVHERLLARAVAVVHAADLRNGGVALVDHEEEVLREEVDEARGPSAGLAVAEVQRVVLDPVAEPHL